MTEAWVLSREIENFSFLNQALPRSSSLVRSEEHTSELQSQSNLVCRLLLEKKKKVSQQPYQSYPFVTSTRLYFSYNLISYLVFCVNTKYYVSSKIST